jgi:hypothetical protein
MIWHHTYILLYAVRGNEVPNRYIMPYVVYHLPEREREKPEGKEKTEELCVVY